MGLRREPNCVGGFHSSKRWLLPVLILRWFTLAALLFAPPLLAANERMQPAVAEGVLEVFVREGCPHCARAKVFLAEFASERPGLRIVYRSVDHDSIARDDLAQYSQNAGIWPPGVPTFVINGRVLVGFDSAERTGP